MKLINREELKAKLDRGDNFKLIMTLSEWAYRAKHIPGSLNIHSIDEALNQLQPAEEIIVYCASNTCPASMTAYELLRSRGYHNVYWYPGGLADWECAGYPLIGEMAGNLSSVDFQS
jgi:rhodanese-related sulfurtransferase